MGIYETIVYTEDDYVQKAVDLGLNKSLREKISARMHKNSPQNMGASRSCRCMGKIFQRAYRSSAYGGTNQYVYKGPLQGKHNGWNGATISSTSKLPQPPKAHLKLAIRIHQGAKKPKSRMLVCRLKK